MSLNYPALGPSELGEPTWMSLCFISYVPNSDIQRSSVFHGHWKLKSVHCGRTGWSQNHPAKMSRTCDASRMCLPSLNSPAQQVIFFLPYWRKDQYFLGGIPKAGLAFGALLCAKCMFVNTRIGTEPNVMLIKQDVGKSWYQGRNWFSHPKAS